eukprot:TRINITY_DN5549_c0_g1_i2.p1 TRINITY_DN5549_c0_g1~~TRINITY_DN5549_c0_g1_i2.p1  ORF type:complete len:198 (+),score=29.12 TRINITY_DN5549_c0_g1_i2:307-900(+)
MYKRDPGTAPEIGARVPYVIIQSTKDSRNYEKAEDPLYVLENNIPLDTKYYLEHQLALPLTRLFEPIMENPSSLLNGDHTLSIFKPTPTPQKGNITQFAKRLEKCQGCRGNLDTSNSRVLCSNCRPREGDIYRDKVNKVSQLENKFASVWTQCQDCQGSLHQEVLCTSRDCPIFYMRKKIQKDLNDAQESLARLTIW